MSVASAPVSSPSGAASSSSSPSPGSSQPPTQSGNGAPSGQPQVPGSQPNANGAPPPAAKKLTRVEKINGTEQQIEASEDELWAAYRHKSAAEARMREAAEFRKQAATERKAKEDELRQYQARMEKLREDPFSLHRDDPNFDELGYLTERMEALTSFANLSPEQRRIAQLEQQLQQRQQADQQQQAEMERRREEALDRQELSQIGERFMRVLPKVGLPKDDLTLELMAKAFFTNLEQGYELSDEELGVAAKEQLTSHMNSVVKGLSDDEVLDMFPEWRERIHQALVARYKRMAGQPSTPGESQSQDPAGAVQRPPVAEEPPKRMNDYEAHKDMERRAGRRILRTL